MSRGPRQLPRRTIREKSRPLRRTGARGVTQLVYSPNFSDYCQYKMRPVLGESRAKAILPKMAALAGRVRGEPGPGGRSWGRSLFG